MNKNFTVGGLFSGVGGIELGFKQAGFEIAWSNEIDKYACKTYKENFPNHKLFGKCIQDFIVEDLDTVDPVDILVAGFPCQPFSIAGNRNGFLDNRGNLFYSIMEVLDGLDSMPRVLLLENVKNFATHDSGKTYTEVKKNLNERGYTIFKRVIDASKHTFVPQHRERTFMFCIRDEYGLPPEDQIVTRSLQKGIDKTFPDNPKKKEQSFREFLEDKENVEAKYYLDNFYEKELLDKSVVRYDTVYQWRRIYFRDNKSNQCPTLTANMGTGGWNVPIILTDEYNKSYRRKRKLTPRECFNLQGFPSKSANNGYKFKHHFKIPEDLSNTQLYKQAGNSVAVPLIRKLANTIKKVF